MMFGLKCRQAPLLLCLGILGNGMAAEPPRAIPQGPRTTLLAVNTTEVFNGHPQKGSFDTTLQTLMLDGKKQMEEVAAKWRTAAGPGGNQELAATLQKQYNELKAASDKELAELRASLMKKVVGDILGAVRKVTERDVNFVIVYPRVGDNSWPGRYFHNLPDGIPDISFAVIEFLKGDDMSGTTQRNIVTNQFGYCYKLNFEQAIAQHPRAAALRETLQALKDTAKSEIEKQVAELQKVLEHIRERKSKGESEPILATLVRQARDKEQEINTFRQEEEKKLTQLQGRLVEPLLKDVEKAITGLLPADELFLVVSDRAASAPLPGYEVDFQPGPSDMTQQVIERLKQTVK